MSDRIPHVKYFDNALPCPFCGSTRILEGYISAAICTDCGATGPDEKNREKKLKTPLQLWNYRSGEVISREEEDRYTHCIKSPNMVVIDCYKDGDNVVLAELSDKKYFFKLNSGLDGIGYITLK